MVRKTNLIFTAIIAIAMMALTGCPEADLSNVGGTVGIESAAAPVIKDATCDGGIVLSWKPVLNADYYYVYRAEKGENGKFGAEKVLGTVYNNTLYPDIVSATNPNAIVDGNTYKYRVVAVAGKDHISDSESTKTVKIKLAKAKGEKVDAASNVNVEYKNNALYFTFDKSASTSASVTYNLDVTGIDIAEKLFPTASAVYNAYEGAYIADAPYMGGAKIKYTITTKWAYGDGYYADNTVTGEYTIPTAGVAAPYFGAYNTGNGITINIEASDASLALYRAEAEFTIDAWDDIDELGVVKKFEKIADNTKFTLVENKECENSYKYYTYNDETVELGKGYIYILTGTLNGKALEYNGYRVVSYDFDYDNDDFADESNFQVLNMNDGTVDLSWTVLDGWSYSIERCLMEEYTGHVSETAITEIGSIDNKIMGVKVYTDKITKVEKENQYYKYTLIGTKNGETRMSSNNNTQVSDYKYGSYAFEIDDIDVTSYDSTVDIAIEVANQYNLSAIKFYRAKKNTEIGTYIEEFKEIAVIKTDESTDYTSSKVYHYLDKEAKESGFYYEYNIKLGDMDDTDGETVYIY